MENILKVFFIIIVLGFFLMISFEIFKKTNINNNFIKTKTEIKNFGYLINNFCINKIYENRFIFHYYKPFKIFLDKNKLCVNYKDLIYCSLIKCNINNKLLFNKTYPEVDYLCYVLQNKSSKSLYIKC